MIIFAKADGTVIETKPTPFYQGSSLKGSIYLVAPFPNTNGVTIQFQLPNGNLTKAYPMTPTGEVEGVMLDGYEVSAWTWNVKNAMVTAIPGVVTATIKVIDTDNNVTSIVSSFSIIKGTPNALDVSTPSPSEWETIISELNAIGGKVTKPLMTNFEYNPLTGESVKSYNNGAVQTVEFPRALPEGYYLEEYQSFTKTEFTNAWETLDDSDFSKMLTIENSTIQTNEFDIAVFRLDGNIAEKMNPLIVVDKENSTVKIYSNEAYAGYALFFWKGSFIEQNYLPAIENAIKNAETATDNTNNAIKNAEDIVSEIQEKLDNGDFVGAPFRIYKVYASKAEMQADFENDDVPRFGFVVIETGEVNNPDNAQLYMKDANSWVFITDLSGAQGIQGPQGRRGKSFLFYYGKVTDKNGNIITSPEIGVRYNINRDELEEFPMLGDLFIDSAGNIYQVAGIGASTQCVWTEVSVRNVNLLPGQGNGSIIKQGFTTTDTDGNTYEVPDSEATGDGAISLFGRKYYGDEDEQGKANGKQSLNGAASGLADGDFSATFNKDTKAYQGASLAVNGHSEAGMTIAEFNDKYATASQKATAGYDRTKLNGGVEGMHIVEPHQGLEYDESWSFAHASGERTKAKGRASEAGGFKSYAYENFSKARGVCLTADRIGQSVDGVYNKRDTDATYIIGNGWELNGKDFTTGTEPTAPEKTSEIKEFNNFYVSKRGEVIIDGEKLDTFGTNYIPAIKLIQHPNGYTGAIHHPLSIWWTNNDATTAKAELMAKDNASGTNGHVSLEYFKYRNPSQQTESSYIRLYKDRVETNKPIYANGVLLGAGESSSGGAKFSYYTGIVRNDYGHGDTAQYILFPDFANIAKIEIDSFITAEGMYDGYQLSDFYCARTPQELGITSPVIYDNGRFNSISFVKNVDYSDTEFVLSWYNYDKTLALPDGVEGSYESFKIDNIVFKIYPKEE